MDVGAPLVTNRQASIPLQPREGAFNDPALASQGRLLFSSLCDRVARVMQTATDPVALVVVGLAGMQHPLVPRRKHRLGRLHQSRQGRAFRHVGGAQGCGHGHALLIGIQVMLAAGFAAIRRLGSGSRAPFFAATSDESITKRPSAKRSVCFRSSKKNSSRRCQTPSCCQSRKRRQQVIPDPQPSSCGRASDGMPVLRTNRIPVRTRR